jgi:serine/threonine protein phosphatase PrpC
MGVTAKWRSGVATDAGLMRPDNEDRSYVDDERGIFMVVDGVGGHAAGEKAAELALQVIPAELASAAGDLKDRIRLAITEANNEISRIAETDQAWQGMACVLTLAVVNDDRITVGHVGDSRLYLAWNGALKKLTSDHSPVGEREDRGELTEEEAMLHPRRHEVFRDVGSRLRAPDEGDFIEIREFLFKPDAAVLLCSDGLSDLLTSAEMREIIERYEGDPERTAGELVEAANAAGGSDNITVIFVAGSEFIGSGCQEMAEARARHSITRTRAGAALETQAGLGIRVNRLLTTRTAFLIYGFVLGILIAIGALKLR